MIARRFNTTCLAKGGHLPGGEVVDVLCTDSDDLTLYTAPRIKIRGTHGTGCTFSAALTAALALDEPLHEAVAHAKHVVIQALDTARPAGRHSPLNLRG